MGYVDGFNQYEYVGGAPIHYGDPLGLWRWEGGKRQGQSRAIMIAEDGDTIASAAVFVQLEPSESSKWLKDKDGNWVGQDTPIEKGCHYTVPNIVYVTSGNMSTKKNRKMNWKSGFPLLLNAAVKSRTEEHVRGQIGGHPDI